MSRLRAAAPAASLPRSHVSSRHDCTSDVCSGNDRTFLSVGLGSRLNSGWRTRCQSIWGRGLLPRGAFPHLWRWLAVAAPAAATLGYPWLPWLPLATLLAALGYPWLHLATLAYPWLPFATVGYPWLPLTTLGYPACPGLPLSCLGHLP